MRRETVSKCLWGPVRGAAEPRRSLVVLSGSGCGERGLVLVLLLLLLCQRLLAELLQPVIWYDGC
jgi:hypothetical protein